MKAKLKNHFVPHAGNDYKPHFLREKSVATTALLAVVLFLASIFGNQVVRTSPQLASIKAAFLVDLANDDRQDQGLSPLVINEKLVSAAGTKAADMAAKGYFAHQSPDGRMPWDFITAAGYSYIYAGENLAVNFYDSGEVERAWMDSPTHRKNIMNDRYTEIGIATAPGIYKGDSTVFVVQMFGRPRTAQPVAAPATAVVEASLAVTSTSASVSEPDNVLGEEIALANSESSSSAYAETPAAAASVPVRETETAEIQNPEVTEQEASAPLAAAAAEPAPEYTTWWQRLLVSPSEVVQDLYTVLFAVVVFSLILKIFIEIRLQHPKNILYGVLLLAIIGIFMFWNSTLATPIITLG